MKKDKTLLELLQWLPKTTIATIISAILIYCLSKWYIDADLTQLISAIMVWLWISINMSSWKFGK